MDHKWDTSPGINVPIYVRRIEYDGLHNVCFGCGRFGHNEAVCPKNSMVNTSAGESSGISSQVSQKRIEKERPKIFDDFGLWMLATRRRRRGEIGAQGRHGAHNQAKLKTKIIVATKSTFDALEDLNDELTEFLCNLEATNKGDMDETVDTILQSKGQESDMETKAYTHPEMAGETLSGVMRNGGEGPKEKETTRLEPKLGKHITKGLKGGKNRDKKGHIRWQCMEVKIRGSHRRGVALPGRWRGETKRSNNRLLGRGDCVNRCPPPHLFQTESNLKTTQEVQFGSSILMLSHKHFSVR
ncbi:unnamed protein product [Linum trigynum]|uniref:CCHC-type domain-containing protein n=1 Tax=Linum trigynum TaxID=586398 RepID=A0AAV2F4V1_9ROSI